MVLLNEAAAPAVRAAVKTELSYRNDMVTVFFSSQLTKIKTMLKFFWYLEIVNLRTEGLI